MADQLYQILAFEDVAPGDTVTLPHNITSNGVDYVPDRVERDNGSFSIDTVTATHVTVTNNGSGVDSCNVLLELWHSLTRALGSSTSTGNFTAGLTPRPFVPAAGGGSGGGVVIGQTVVGGTPGSVLFVDPSGDLGQDNTAFYTGSTPNGSRAVAVGGQSVESVFNAYQTDIDDNYLARLQTFVVLGAVRVGFRDADGFQVGTIGWSGGADGLEPNYAGYFVTNWEASSGWIVGTSGTVYLRSVDGGLQFENSGSANVSDAGTGKLRYDTVNDRLQLSNDSAAYANVLTTPDLGEAQRFTFTAAGGEGSDFTVTLPTAMSTDDYVVIGTLNSVAVIFGFNCPDTLAGDRTTTAFRVITTTALTAGDKIDFYCALRT